jgi:hypothetical protein
MYERAAFDAIFGFFAGPDFSGATFCADYLTPSASISSIMQRRFNAYRSEGLLVS